MTNMTSFNGTHHEMDLKLEKNASFSPENCPIFSDHDEAVIDSFRFWVEGVLQSCIALLGIKGNSITIYMICGQKEKHAFNLLLMCMLCFNNWYLFGSILESFRKSFHMVTYVHTILFPQLLYPAQHISMSASIYLTCGITIERYIAVHYPINYNKSIASSSTSRRRMLKYLIPIIALSIFLNVPKFFEAKIIYKPTSYSHTFVGRSKDVEFQEIRENAEEDYQVLVPNIQASNLRKNQYYAIYYNSWTRLMFLGIVPTFVLIYFNFQIHNQMKVRQTLKNSFRYVCSILWLMLYFTLFE